MKNAGIGAILSVNDGTQCYVDEIRACGIRYECMPLSCNAPPREGDLEHNLAALDNCFTWIAESERSGHATLVHCHSGKDRTGLVLAYYLRRKLQMTTSEAISFVKKVQPIAFSAPGWETFAVDVLDAA